MRSQQVFLLLLIFGLLSCSRTQQNDNASKPPHLVSLPDNPCDLLDPAQVASTTGLEITSVNRVPSLLKVVEAQNQQRELGPDTICHYETRGDFGGILITVPPPADRSAAEYWKSRAKYFETSPVTVQTISGLETDARFSGGTTLHVLVGGREHFTLSTQIPQRRSREILVKLARVILAQPPVGATKVAQPSAER